MATHVEFTPIGVLVKNTQSLVSLQCSPSTDIRRLVAGDNCCRGIFVRVSTKYGLSTPVPFVDVHVERDNRLFLDPSAIRNGRDSRSRHAHALIVDFFTEVLRLRRSTKGSDHRQGQALLNSIGVLLQHVRAQ